MRTLFRSILYTVLQTLVLILLVSKPVTNWNNAVIADSFWGVSLIHLEVIISIVVLNEFLFQLIGARIGLRDRIIHYFILAVFAFLGLFLVRIMDLSQLNFSVKTLSTAQIALLSPVLIINLLGYWFASLITQPLPKNIPSAVRDALFENEKVEAWIQQIRLFHAITPDNLIATTSRLLVHRPTNFGLTHKTESRLYSNFVDMKTDYKLFSCTMTIIGFVRTDEMVFTSIPRYKSKHFIRTVAKHIGHKEGALINAQRHTAAQQGDGHRNEVPHPVPQQPLFTIQPTNQNHYSEQRSRGWLTVLKWLFGVLMWVCGVFILLALGVWFLDPVMLKQLPWFVQAFHDWLIGVIDIFKQSWFMKQ